MDIYLKAKFVRAVRAVQNGMITLAQVFRLAWHIVNQHSHYSLTVTFLSHKNLLVFTGKHFQTVPPHHSSNLILWCFTDTKAFGLIVASEPSERFLVRNTECRSGVVCEADVVLGKPLLQGEILCYLRKNFIHISMYVAFLPFKTCQFLRKILLLQFLILKYTQYPI